MLIMNDNSTQNPPQSNLKKRKKRYGVIIPSLVVALLLLFTLIYFLPFLTKGASSKAIIRIPAGASAQTVGDSISKYLGRDYSSMVITAAKLTKTDFSKRHGAYLIEEGMAPARAARRLSKGAQHPLTLTINGFRSLPLLAERVARRLDFSADSLIDFVSRREFLEEYGLSPRQALALFIDDSYEVYWSASPADIAGKITDNFRKVWNPQRREKAARLGLTPAEVMTICSIVDEETNKIDEKGKIGRLYINRLKIGMPLQADPTVRFALNDFTIRRVKGEHLKVASPYNTYRNKGLPPGPIRTSSVATIDRVLDSEPNDYLYMCAKEDFSGYHNFASSLAEHKANARKYQQELNKRGIK